MMEKYEEDKKSYFILLEDDNFNDKINKLTAGYLRPLSTHVIDGIVATVNLYLHFKHVLAQLIKEDAKKAASLFVHLHLDLNKVKFKLPFIGYRFYFKKEDKFFLNELSLLNEEEATPIENTNRKILLQSSSKPAQQKYFFLVYYITKSKNFNFGISYYLLQNEYVNYPKRAKTDFEYDLLKDDFDNLKKGIEPHYLELHNSLDKLNSFINNVQTLEKDRENDDKNDELLAIKSLSSFQ